MDYCFSYTPDVHRKVQAGTHQVVQCEQCLAHFAAPVVSQGMGIDEEGDTLVSTHLGGHCPSCGVVAGLRIDY